MSVTLFYQTPLLNYSLHLLTFVAKRQISYNIFARLFVAFLHCQSHSPFTWWQIADTISTKICRATHIFPTNTNRY